MNPLDSRMSPTRAMDLLRGVVLTKGPDYVYKKDDGTGLYTTCEYVHGPDSEAHTDEPEGPGCIVGHVMVEWGTALDDLKNVEGTVPNGDHPLWKDNLTPEAALLLRRAQASQDRGATWGVALGKAQALYEVVAGI